MAHEPAVLPIRQQRPQSLMHRLVAVAQTIQDIAHSGHVEVLANGLFDFSSVGKHISFSVQTAVAQALLPVTKAGQE
jgi:hypothetical protein